jgi:UDP-N-acetylmuramyl pentapeptide synthase
MLNKVFLDDDGVINIVVAGDQTGASVREMADKLQFFTAKLRAEHRPVLILDNILGLTGSTDEARREVAKVARTIDCDRAVMVGGGSLALRYSTNLMLAAIGRANFRYFTALQPARRWLKGFTARRG